VRVAVVVPEPADQAQARRGSLSRRSKFVSAHFKENPQLKVETGEAVNRSVSSIASVAVQ
jgi:hypothetical protein